MISECNVDIFKSKTTCFDLLSPVRPGHLIRESLVLGIGNLSGTDKDSSYKLSSKSSCKVQIPKLC